MAVQAAVAASEGLGFIVCGTLFVLLPARPQYSLHRVHNWEPSVQGPSWPHHCLTFLSVCLPACLTHLPPPPTEQTDEARWNAVHAGASDIEALLSGVPLAQLPPPGTRIMQHQPPPSGRIMAERHASCTVCVLLCATTGSIRIQQAGNVACQVDGALAACTHPLSRCSYI